MTKPIITIDTFYFAWCHEMRRETRLLEPRETAPERIAAFTFQGPTSALADAGSTVILRPTAGVQN